MSKGHSGSIHGPGSLIDDVDRRSNKAFRSGAESLSRSSTTRRPRMEMARLSGFSAGRDRHANGNQTGPTLLDLPLELREHIYHSALRDTATRLCRPYDRAPGHDRFNTYLNLRMLNKQISHEAETIFTKHYRRDMVFHFDNPPDLWDFWQRIQRFPCLRDTARFCLRSINDDIKPMCRRRDKNLERRETEKFIDLQGYHYQIWRDAPNLYNPHAPSPGGIVLLEDLHGCISKDDNHTECHATTGIESRPYTEIVYYSSTVSGLSCVLRGFLWEITIDPKDGPEKIGSLTLEGRICDLSWDSYDLEKGRKRMKQYKDFLCNGYFPEFFCPRSSFEHAEDHMLAEIDEEDEMLEWEEDQQRESDLIAEYDRLDAEMDWEIRYGFD